MAVWLVSQQLQIQGLPLGSLSCVRAPQASYLPLLPRGGKPELGCPASVPGKSQRTECEAGATHGSRRNRDSPLFLHPVVAPGYFTSLLEPACDGQFYHQLDNVGWTGLRDAQRAGKMLFLDMPVRVFLED